MWYIFTTQTNAIEEMQFSEFVKDHRVNNRISLREFCRQTDFDPSNWSKIERGVLAPPKTPEQLNKIAAALDFEKDTDNYKTLFELAAIEAIPKKILDQEVLNKLPIFFRTVRGDTPTEEELNKLISVLKNSK